MKEKQEGPQNWPFKFIEHFADTTRVLPSPAGPVGHCPLNFLNLINQAEVSSKCSKWELHTVV